jgi:hypothetical protein
MKRRGFLSGLALGLVAATQAYGQDMVASVLAQLRDQGFDDIVEERTLLGRVRITANRADGHREIIINPRTGEILRDLWEPVDGGPTSGRIIADKGQGSDDKDDDDRGHGGEDDGDDDNDDDDDDDDDDHSGPGGD